MEQKTALSRYIDELGEIEAHKVLKAASLRRQLQKIERTFTFDDLHGLVRSTGAMYDAVTDYVEREVTEQGKVQKAKSA